MDDLNLMEAFGVGALLLITFWVATKWEIAGKCLITLTAAARLVGWTVGIVGLIALLVAKFTGAY